MERRFWSSCPEEAYSFSEWYAFVLSLHPMKSKLEVHEETERLWGMAVSRLIDQECVGYNSVLEGALRLDTIVVVVSCGRICVDALKPVMRRDGCLVTFGRPGDSMSGLRGSDPSTWTHPWMAKSIGAVTAGLQIKNAQMVRLVYLSNGPQSGSQTEWELRGKLQEKIATELGEEATAEVVLQVCVVDTEEVLRHYGLDRRILELSYAPWRKKVFLLRHGESEANVGGDQLHPRLTARGLEQASAVQEFEVDTVICSPHLRTLETYARLKIRGHPSVHVASAVSELNRYEMQNQIAGRAEVETLLAELKLKTAQHHFDAEVTGDDNAVAVNAALEFLSTMPGEILLVVCHRVLIREMTGLDVDNCEVVLCELDHLTVESPKVLRLGSEPEQ